MEVSLKLVYWFAKLVVDRGVRGPLRRGQGAGHRPRAAASSAQHEQGHRARMTEDKFVVLVRALGGGLRGGAEGAAPARGGCCAQSTCARAP